MTPARRRRRGRAARSRVAAAERQRPVRSSLPASRRGRRRRTPRCGWRRRSLGRHMLGRAEDVGPRPGAAVVVHHRQPEVDRRDRVAADQDRVAGLEVAVDDAEVVGCARRRRAARERSRRAARGPGTPRRRRRRTTGPTAARSTRWRRPSRPTPSSTRCATGYRRRGGTSAPAFDPVVRVDPRRRVRAAAAHPDRDGGAAARSTASKTSATPPVPSHAVHRNRPATTVPAASDQPPTGHASPR